MVGAEVSVILDGWCNVFHQSTEYLITGKLKRPIIAIIEEILFAFLKLLIDFQLKIYAI